MLLDHTLDRNQLNSNERNIFLDLMQHTRCMLFIKSFKLLLYMKYITYNTCLGAMLFLSFFFYFLGSSMFTYVQFQLFPVPVLCQFTICDSASFPYPLLMFVLHSTRWSSLKCHYKILQLDHELLQVFLNTLVNVTRFDLPLWHRILVLEVLRVSLSSLNDEINV